MKIVFKTGHELEVLYDVAEVIKDRILQGADAFQTFTDKNGKLFLVINISEILYIQ